MIAIRFACRLELFQMLPDNAKIRSVDDLTKQLYETLRDVLEDDMTIKIEYPVVTTSTPFD